MRDRSFRATPTESSHPGAVTDQGCSLCLRAPHSLPPLTFLLLLVFPPQRGMLPLSYGDLVALRLFFLVGGRSSRGGTASCLFLQLLNYDGLLRWSRIYSCLCGVDSAGAIDQDAPEFATSASTRSVLHPLLAGSSPSASAAHKVPVGLTSILSA